ncbi:MAG: type II toxin-antitoxin system PemK/MazF family toxin [Deltaproteobacteria bacterium]|nr:type II toxin-antitoxin system PemK/MazF family toxin [Deltaproteobacteria bacterium]
MNYPIQHGYLYLADLNPRIGSESGKIRPVLVIQTNYLNSVQHPSTWILPCTTKLTEENILRVRLEKGIAENLEACEIMIDQSRSIDNQRFRKALGQMPKALLNEVKEKLRLLADL